MKQLILIVSVICLSLSGFSQQAIHIEKKGTGKPIIFLPGFACPGSVWDETVAQLPVGYAAHLISYAGFDGLAPIPMPWYDSLKVALINYIKKENLTSVYVVGHSMGGNLATDLAAELPEHCKKIMLVDALPCMRELMMPGVSASQIQYESPYNKQMLERSAEQIANYSKMMATNMTLDTVKARLISEWMQKADRTTFVLGYTDLLKLDLRESLHKIKCPVTVLGASFPTAEITKANFEKQYSNLTNKQIKIAANSRHFIMFDQPQWFYAELNSFLAQ